MAMHYPLVDSNRHVTRSPKGAFLFSPGHRPESGRGHSSSPERARKGLTWMVTPFQGSGVLIRRGPRAMPWAILACPVGAFFYLWVKESPRQRKRKPERSNGWGGPKKYLRTWITACLLLTLSAMAQITLAQTSSLNGFVTDGSDGRPLERATVALYSTNGNELTLRYGAATNDEGFYIIRGIDPGAYRWRISFIGYVQQEGAIMLTANASATVTVSLEPDLEQIDEVLIESERTSGVARIEAGRQQIRPEDIEMIPAPDLSADLANYLTTLPGVVAIADQGGQFFIRGGEPPQNLTMLDGMIVYQPFHVLGMFSVFPADIINTADFYAGGFGAKYVGRMSSVIDVSARAGNNRRFAGMASVSPFTGAFRLEGPVYPGVASFIVSGRQSLIDRVDSGLYGASYPYDFNDVFGKFQFTPGSRHRFSFTGFNAFDSGRLVEDITGATPQQIEWTNGGYSVSWLALSKNLPLATRLTYSSSSHEIKQLDEGSALRSSRISNTRLALDATFSEGTFAGGRSTTIAGWDVEFGRARNALNGLFQNFDGEARSVASFGFYLEPTMVYPNGLTLSTGLRFQGYNTRLAPYPEPRLRAEFERGIHHFSAAAGLYNQQIIGINDRRDPVNVFTAWTGIPRDGEAGDQKDLELLRDRIGRSLHFLLGYRSNPKPWLEYALEGFYKHYTNLIVSEWTAFPRLTTRLQPAIGRSFGLELRAEVRRPFFSAFVTYGLSNTRYGAEGNAISLVFGEDRFWYRPPHDRRHNLNAVGSVTLAGFEFSLRWQFGSGLPYTKPLAFDGFALIDGLRSAFDFENSRRVIYDKPYGAELPTYHRLDVSIEKTWKMRRASLTLLGSALNLYDRRNIFYVDIFTLRRTDQLPFIPSAGLRVAFE